MLPKNATKLRIINEINEKHGLDLLDIEKCRTILKNYEQQRNECQTHLTLTNTSSSIGLAVNNIDKNIEDVAALLKRSSKISKEVNTHLDEVDEIRRSVEEYFSKLNILQSTLQYMNVVKVIENLSSDLCKEISNKDDERSATVFANLCEVSRNLIDSRADNLCHYLKDTVLHWHGILKDKFAHDLDEVLKAIKWPFVNTNFSLQTPTQANIQKLQIITEYLLQIELPDESTSPLITSAMLSDFPPLCLPIHFLVLPLRKRFLYHFYGSRQTNRIDKPEWYFTQILSWIRDHMEFVVTWIQPIIDKLGMHHIDAKMDLMRGLVQLAVEKLYSELPNLQFDDFTFSHSVDEALGFDKELRETYSYPTTQPSVLAVLTQAQIFMKWIAMEKKYATEKMDAMLSSSGSVAFQTLTSDAEEVKVTICADSFITLLQTITDRYESLPQPGHRLQFLELQLELLDDFRVRLLQLINAENSDIGESTLLMIANTVYYVENVLVDWGAMLHYLNLFYYKSQMGILGSNGDIMEYGGRGDFELEAETVFSDTLSLYQHMRKDLLSSLAETVVLEVKSRSRNYRSERWSTVQAHKDFRTLSLTPTACSMFEVLARRLHQLQKSLTGKLFLVVWRFIAEQLDTYLFEELVLDNKFNEGGATQLKFDVTRNLFPLFSQFSEKPENHFTQLHESCNLLNITKGSALLLRETLLALEGATGVEDKRGQALKEIGVVHFSPKRAVTILNQRTDITVNRLSID